jgi:hypothetical protein
MQGKFFPDLLAGGPARAEFGEKIKGNCGEQDFRIPKAEARLQNCVRYWRRRIHGAGFSMNDVALLVSGARH